MHVDRDKILSRCAVPEVPPTLLIITQVYVPDPASVGQHVADVAKEMVRRGWRVLVYTSARGYDDPSQRYRRRETLDGVDVRRLPLSSFGKRSIPIRLIAQACFMVQAVVLGLVTRRLGLVLVSTSPPFAGIGGAMLSWLRRVPLVWWVMDLNPDQMVASGKLSPRSVVARVFDWMNRVTLRRSRAVVVMDRFMRERVLAKLDVPEKLHVLPPWPHEDVLKAVPSRPNAFRDERGFGDAFVVMYSGNHGIQNPLQTLLDAARLLEERNDLLFVFIGGGAGKIDVDRRVAEGARNIRSLPFQPLSRIGTSLSAADVHVVSLANEAVGVIHPCKIYGAMAIGRPVLFFGPEASHVGDIFHASDIGRVVAHGDARAAVAAIQELIAMGDDGREAMGRRATGIISASFSSAGLLGRFCDILDDAGRPSR
jgi:glycosyltransferase involved in cell wall biosynthesis